MKSSSSRRKMIQLNMEQDLCCLDTVFEVPVPEEFFAHERNGSKRIISRSKSLLSWRSAAAAAAAAAPLAGDDDGGRESELQLLLGVAGAPLVPSPIQETRKSSITNNGIKTDPIESSMAKYIVKQYIAAVGGEEALDSIQSMYAMGKVRMVATDIAAAGANKRSSRGAGAGGEMGCFVLWQKKPELWCIELVVSGCKITAGSDGRVAWRQTPWHQPHASRGPTRPLRRSLQGLDPRSTANLFSSSVCLGEKTIDGGDGCFVLRFDTEDSVLRARSSNGVEIVRHTVWGCFSQRTGLLVRLEDSYMLKIKAAAGVLDESVYWETVMESSIEDYRTVDGGVRIAHSGRTSVTLFRLRDDDVGAGAGEEAGWTRTRMEEEWSIEEVDFNVRGLCMECFLPPGDLRDDIGAAVPAKSSVAPPPATIRGPPAIKLGSSKVAALNLGGAA